MKANIKNVLKKTLASFGLELRKIDKPIRSGAVSPSSGLIVEFMGPSGVGKSTLFDHVAPAFRKRWYFQSDAAKFRNNSFTLPVETQISYEKIVRRMAKQVWKRPAHLAERSDLMCYLLNLVVNDMALIARRYSKGFFLHDGICHNFAVPILECLQDDEEDIKCFVKRRAYIFIFADRPGTVIKNIYTRRESSPRYQSNNFPGRTDAELLEMYKKNNIQLYDLQKILRKMSCLILILRAEDDLQVKSSKIMAFESDLILSKVPNAPFSEAR